MNDDPRAEPLTSADAGDVLARLRVAEPPPKERNRPDVEVLVLVLRCLGWIAVALAIVVFIAARGQSSAMAAVTVAQGCALLATSPTFFFMAWVLQLLSDIRDATEKAQTDT